QLNERRLVDLIDVWYAAYAIDDSRHTALNRLYSILLHNAINSGSPEDSMRRDLDDQTGSKSQNTTTEQLKMVITLLALTNQPLSTEMITEITTVPVDKLVLLLQGMSSVFRIPDAFRSSGGDASAEAKRQAIEPYSQSFIDFIVSGGRINEEETFHVRLGNYTSKFAAMTLDVVCRPQTKRISRAVEYSALCWHHYVLTGLSPVDFDRRLFSFRSCATRGLETLSKASETQHGRGRRIIGVAYAATIIALAFPKPDITEETFTDFISIFKSVEKHASSSPNAPPIPTEPEERLLKKAEELTDHQARSLSSMAVSNCSRVYVDTKGYSSPIPRHGGNLCTE
ncbi:hypothetical protein BKA62DRAFT_814215, partial [Auriculariales sp. MPI-PUGE-AT-0066]